MDEAMLIDDHGIQIRVLGPVEVMTKNGIAQLGGPKQRALLAMLASRAGRVVTTNDLIDGIWGEEPPNEVLNSIHTYVSHLRTRIDQPIERRGSGYLLGAEISQIDANAFEEALETGRRDLVANPMAASDRLRRALGLWRGGAYADVADFPGLVGEAQRLSELRLSAVEARIEADLTLGRHAALIGELESLTTEYPLRESLRAKHMLALYRDGRQADALRAFRRTEEYLREELGIDPSTELQELESRILNHDYTLIHSREVVSEQVALLFTDIVHSTLLWESNPAVMQAALARHDDLIQTAIESAAGTVIKGLGDGFIAAFSEPALAARAAVAAQQALTSSDWSPLDFAVRMALDTGEVERRGGDLFGSPMNRGSRLLNAAHGGQILLSNEVQKEIKRDAGTQIKSLGEHRFKGLGAPIEVFQLLASGLRVEFPAPQTSSAAMELDRSFGDSIRGYELRERIGRGAFATVYRGFQPSIGREVAIKIVKPEFANHPAFVRRFESEARFVASLEHPHIVSVYDYWRDADGAYVVGPYLAGRSLADAVFATMSRDQVMKIANQVGSALSYAHRQGVLHRDIKPANVLLDRDGNAYLADFGIAARAVEEATGVMSESAGYRAPEDQKGEAVDLHSDIYSLAALIAHLLTGRQPGDFDFGGLDRQLRDALERGLAPDPRSRPESVDQFLDLLKADPGTSPSVRSAVSRRNPYKGLAAFQQTDAPDFFGRVNEITRLVAMVLKHRLSAVIGPSGSGKSSLVLAGLLPALHQGAAHQSETWVSVKAVPGGYPFDELATALSAVSTESLSDLATELAAEDGKGLLRVAKRIGIELDGDLVIVLDQFEELFTLVVSDSERNHFVSTLVTAASDPLSRVRIVLTLRADFFHQVLSHPELGPVISLANLALAPLDSERIRLAIVEPARKSGLELEPGLADRIIADLADQPGSLPLLQFTLDRLATLASEGQITNAQYDALGGVKGALAERAQAAYQTLTERQQEAAQQIFTRLLTVSDEADDVRRRVRVTEVRSLGLVGSDVNEVLDTFGQERLLTFDIDPTTRGATVEVAHEALLREWPTLRTWVDSRRESLVLQRRFQVAFGEWEGSDRNPSNLLTGGKLNQYEEWAAGQDVTVTTAEREFLEASIERRTGETRERRARRRGIMAGFAGAAVVALVLALVAFIQRGQAEQNAALAEARGFILEAEKQVTIDPELAMLLALEAMEAFRTSGEETPPSAQAVLRRGMALDRVVARVPGGRFVSVSGDGTLFATRGEGDTVVVRKVATREVVTTLPLPQLDAAWALLHPSGDWLVVLNGGAHALRSWDLRSPDRFFDFGPADADVGRAFDSATFSPDGELIVIPVGIGPASLEVWSFPEGERQYSLGQDLTVGGSFSRDGRLAYFEYPEGEPPFLHIVEVATGRELQAIRLDTLDLPAAPFLATFSPDGSRLAIADQQSIAMVDLDSAKVLWGPLAPGQRANEAIWLQDGERLFVGGENLASILDAGTGEVIEKVSGHQGGTFSYVAVPGTDWVASGGLNDEQTVIFDLGPPLLAELGTFLSASFPDVRFMRAIGDGDRLAVSDIYSTGVIDADTGDLIDSREAGLDSPHLNISRAETSADGLYTTGLDQVGKSRIWSNLDGSELFAAEDGWQIRGISEDATLAVLVELVATQEPDNRAEAGSTRLVRTRDGMTVAELEVVEGQWWRAVFSPDGHYVATIVENTIQIWDTRNGVLLGSIEEYELVGASALWTSDGSRLIVGGYDGIINTFDVEELLKGIPDWEAIIAPRITAHDTGPMVVADLKDGSLLLTQSRDEPAKLWDLETGAFLGEFGTPVEGDFVAAAFHPTEPKLYAEVGADQIGIFTLDPNELIEIARSRLSRELTEEECQLYLRRSCAENK